MVFIKNKLFILLFAAALLCSCEKIIDLKLDNAAPLVVIDAGISDQNENQVVKTFIKNKEVASIKLDPYKETADINDSNNSWNVIPEPSKFTVFKGRVGGARGGAGQVNNPMQKAAEKKKAF